MRDSEPTTPPPGGSGVTPPEEVLASSTALLDTGGTKVHIVGDGTRAGTKVLLVHADGTEEPMRGVQRIEYAISVDEAPIRARITVRQVAVDMIVQADIIDLPDEDHS